MKRFQQLALTLSWLSKCHLPKEDKSLKCVYGVRNMNKELICYTVILKLTMLRKTIQNIKNYHQITMREHGMGKIGN